MKRGSDRWRIIQVIKWLITMVIISHLRIGLCVPLPNSLSMASKWIKWMGNLPLQKLANVDPRKGPKPQKENNWSSSPTIFQGTFVSFRGSTFYKTCFSPVFFRLFNMWWVVFPPPQWLVELEGGFLKVSYLIRLALGN